jgi:hypothetical protein
MKQKEKNYKNEFQNNRTVILDYWIWLRGAWKQFDTLSGIRIESTYAIFIAISRSKRCFGGFVHHEGIMVTAFSNLLGYWSS